MILIQAVSNHCLFDITFTGIIRHYLSMPRIARVVVADYPHHIIQRGNNRQMVFFDDTDRQLYLKLLRKYSLECGCRIKAYCLMDNHFHFLIQQTGKNDMDSFMQSCMTRYTRYFNQKYKRVGPLFQGKYKAVMVESDAQLLYLTRYIHRNSLFLPGADIFCQPSSYSVYLGKTKQAWVKPEFILSNFSISGYNSYESFVEDDDETIEEQSIFTLPKISLD